MDGIRAAADFTQVPWVKRQFSCKLSLDACPGTLNLEITEPEDLKAFDSLKARKGIEITPEEPSFCSAMCHPVRILGKIQGAIVIPCVEDYPENKMEIIAPVHVRKTLSLSAGDTLEVEIL